LIGYVNIQTPVPIRGDVKVIKKSWYSIELQVFLIPFTLFLFLFLFFQARNEFK